MSIQATAWFLYAGSADDIGTNAKLRREDFEIPDLEPDEVLAAPLYGSWEGNMGHATTRKPIDICRQRNEERVIIGNSGVVRVLEVGREVRTVEPGQAAMVVPIDAPDPFGYPQKIWGYDSPGSMGCLSTRIKAKGRNFTPLPANSRHSLAQWGAFPARYCTAWSNWQLAYGTFRLMVGAEQLPAPNVWGWGGGTSLAELDLARRHGAKTVMLTSSDARMRYIERFGVTPLDRRPFGNLNFDERRFATDLAYRKQYLAGESAFLAEVERRTEGLGVQIFIDHIGTAVLRATMRARGRESVICTAGWKEGMVIHFLRSVECIGHHQHVHTHFARRDQVVAAIEYAEAHDWIPDVSGERVYGFDEIPTLADKYVAGECSLFPIYSVCTDLA